MRVSNSQLVQRLFASLTRAQSNSQEALERLSSGKRVRQASDDPLAASETLRLRARFTTNAGLTRLGESARADLRTVDGVLSELVNQLTDARTTGQAGGSDVARRNALALDIDAIIENVIVLANTKQDGRYIFSGSEVLTQPYDATGSYSGNGTEVTVQLTSNVSVGVTLDGQRVFGGTSNLINDLQDLAVALRADDETTIRDLTNSIETRIGTVADVRADVGARLNAIERALTLLGDDQIRLQQRISELEDIPIEQAVVEVAETQAASEAASTALVRTAGRSLFDFLA